MCFGIEPGYADGMGDNTSQPKRVTSIGGVFFKCKDPEKLKAWYAAHLGLQTDEWGTNFEWRQADDPSRKGFTQWGPSSDQTRYFEPSTKEFMMNYRVENLEWLRAQLIKEGVTVVSEIKQETYGKFCQIMDLEGNKVELWEPDDLEYEKVVEGRTK